MVATYGEVLTKNVLVGLGKTMRNLGNESFNPATNTQEIKTREKQDLTHCHYGH
jgi:hypothetical protein